jgi:GNAT superfamily N-acetyltransferase
MESLDFSLRPALQHEALALNEIAGRSKSYWPYDEEYLKLCRSVTHVTSEDIGRWPFIVATANEELLGFSAVCEIRGEKMLDHLWIDPPFISKGVGRALFLESVIRAKALGWSKFTIASDPYAEGFYEKMGAKRIGEREAKIKKGFYLPLLEYSFAP